MTITIRPERERDIQAIREVTVRAFAQSDFGHQGEAKLIEQLRASCPAALSLVSEQNGGVVGHILFSPVVIAGRSQEWEGMGLAPLSVDPAHQRQGIGKRLVEAGLDRLMERGCPFVVVLGHPEFYARFGFVPARELGIACEFAGVPEGVFRIKLLEVQPEGLSPGVAKYRPEFSALE